MITFNDFTDGFKSLCSQSFVFKSQDSVSYVVRDNCQFVLSRLDLVCCIRYFLSRLHKIGLSDKIKSDYQFEDYEYFELALYFNRLLRFYNSELGLPDVKLLIVVKPSRLPVNILSAKPSLEVTCALLSDPITNKSCYMCFVDHFVYSSESIDGLYADIYLSDPSLFKSYNVILKVVGS